MAFPRVFISSTCYDLGDLRENLEEFIGEYGFDTVLSENGDVFYHPDFHTQESCLKEVENCHLFILIIGGRFGGSYKTDLSKSIVNAEYEAARSLNIPIFAFVKNEVNEDHRVFVKNQNIAESIHFPSIEKQEYAIKIFRFLDNVRRSESNNGYFSFSYTSEIKDILRKQWAGMFHDFLNNRSQNKLFQRTQSALVSITSINEKIEDLAKSILRSVEGSKAESKIESIENENDAKLFYKKICSIFDINQLLVKNTNILMNIEKYNKWHEFISKFSDFKYHKNVCMLHLDGKKTVSDELFYRDKIGLVVGGDIYTNNQKRLNELQRNFEILKSLDPNRRMEISREFIEIEELGTT